MVIVVGLVTPLNNTSLKLNSVGFYQIVKLLVTPLVVTFDYILDGKILSIERKICLIFVCMFVLICSKADLSFSLNGTICAGLWVPLAALYKVQWGRVKKLYSCSTLALMHVVLPYATLVQTILMPAVDPPGLLSFEWTVKAFCWVGLSGVSAFMVNFSGFLVMGNVGALAHVLVGQFKTSLIMILAVFVFGSRYTLVQILGAIGAIVSIIFYTRATMRQKTSEKNICNKMEAKNGQSKGIHEKENIPLIIRKNMNLEE